MRHWGTPLPCQGDFSTHQFYTAPSSSWIGSRCFDHPPRIKDPCGNTSYVPWGWWFINIVTHHTQLLREWTFIEPEGLDPYSNVTWWLSCIHLAPFNFEVEALLLVGRLANEKLCRDSEWTCHKSHILHSLVSWLRVWWSTRTWGNLSLQSYALRCKLPLHDTKLTSTW